MAQMMQTRQDILEWVEREYGTVPEHLWAKYPDYAVLRNREGKWYGILMNLPGSKLGMNSDDMVDVLNVKADVLLIDLLLGQPGFYPAYHMNKTHWISIVLDGTVPGESICNLLEDSYARTSKARKRK